MSCKFEDLCCNSESEECNYCQYNPDACTQDFFEWNGEGEEPSQEELDAEIMS